MGGGGGESVWENDEFRGRDRQENVGTLNNTVQ